MAKPIIISHRGNLYGPNSVEENRPETIIQAIEKGYDCEIDVWYIALPTLSGNPEDLVGKVHSQLYLGHDFPIYPIDISFLENLKQKLWIHCKNLDALIYLKNFGVFNCFFHDRDEYTITTFGVIWGNINSVMAKEVVCVMPEKSRTLSLNVFGICTDFPIHFTNLIQ
jgi:hypothetical protein